MSGLTRASVAALHNAWATQDPKPGYDRVAMRITVEDACDAGGVERASIELNQDTALWLLRELDNFTRKGSA